MNLKAKNNRRKKSRPEQIGIMVNKLLENFGEKAHTRSFLLNTVWKAIVGERIAEHSRPEQIAGKKLIVHVESSAWMNELTFLKEKIKIKAKNQFSQHGMDIESVIFKLGRIR